MMSEEQKKQNWVKKVLAVLGLIVAVFVIAFFIYVSIYYRAGEQAEELFQSTGEVSVSKIEKGYFIDGYGTSEAIIFYPGAKVESKAYLPIFYQVAEQGIDVFIVDMPFHMAFFGLNSADQIREAYSYDTWYLSGHSLGGAMVAEYASKHLEEYAGLVFLASYPTKDMKGEDFRVLTIYGSNDQVLNRERYEETKQYLPIDFQELCIEGGNHGQFGDYGFQKGDGEAIVSYEAQWQESADAIVGFILEK